MKFSDKIVYQIYPKSFNDSNNDGWGDIKGIIEKLDYLKELGVNYLWLCPIFPSPQKDNGYDVSNYTDIDPRYGTLDDFKELVSKARERGIDIMLDMVFNHTSTEHEWFQKALNGDKKYQDYYILKDGKPEGKPPTNWQSKFGGSAWEYSEDFGKYYLHLFDKTQADLNWENEAVRRELAEVVKFWMNLGVKGFRFDVVNLISKEKYEEDPNNFDGRQFYTDGPRVHEFLRELNANSFGMDKSIMTVGEMSSTTVENCVGYANLDGSELSSVFSFHHLKVDYKNQQKWELMDFDFQKLKELISTWQVQMQEKNAWNALFLNNHDQPRAISRFGDDKNYPYESATMLATLTHLLRGTPYIYQGEEIGMTNAYFTHIDDYQDVESKNIFKILKEQGKDEKEIYHILNERSRDNSRTPMQWDESENAGFSGVTPWLAVNKNYQQVNAKLNLAQDKSIFRYYQDLIKLRKSSPAIKTGDYELHLPSDSEIFCFSRKSENEEIMVVLNFYGNERNVELPGLDNYNLILSNYNENNIDASNLKLKPYQAVVLRKGN